MKKTLLSIILGLFSFTTSLAHALWIETNADGAIGKAQEIKIFYGEYAAKEFEETTKWYSDVNTFSLWLVAPDGTKKQLTYTSSDHFFVATFTPDKKGTYVLTTGHSAKDIDGTMIYQFNASATVTVGAATEVTSAIANNELFLVPVKGEKQGVVKAFFKGKPVGKITIVVSGPTGWSKSFETDENGVLKFDLLWKGWYALEGFYTTDEKGNHFDKPYEQIWRCATTRVSL